LTDELSNVDDRAEPRVFGADEVGLLLQVEDGGVGNGGLVELFHQSLSFHQMPKHKTLYTG
jgi:hypothetical protein